MRCVTGALLLSLPLLFVTPVRAELSQKAIEYLKQIGVDPESARVKAVTDDVVPDRQGKLVSLEELALHKNAFAIHRFIATRNFLRAYQADNNTRIPSADDYESSFLTKEERAIVRPAFRKAGDELYLDSLNQKR
ncbi:MAG TPA: hypothetical protein VKT73_14700 [Xanthobacteraceae bacterium]|nr:hypothetical protein [Xanthobacteraceae bacterium]